MRGAVSKSSAVLVRPSSVAVSGDIIKLSPYDEMFVGATNTALLVFSDPIIHAGEGETAAERIKAALSEALVHFPLLAGRLVRGGADGNHIACTSEGVLFVAASSSASIKDVKYSEMGGSPLLEELAVSYPPEGCGRHDPLLLMQVTQFPCGGFVVGITSSHAASDGAGMGQFMQAVGELARGLPAPAVVPVTRDDSLKALPPYMGGVVRVIERILRGSRGHDLSLLGVTISSDLINRARDASGGCTVFEAVTAVLWRCRTRATMADQDADAPTALSISIDARRYVGASHGYYRNCTVVHLAVAKAGLVANASIVDLVRLIQHAKHQLPRTMMQEDLGLDLEMTHKLDFYNLCVVTHWGNMGLAATDFGAGKPATLLGYRKSQSRFPSNIITRNNGNDGGCNVLSSTVTEEHAQAFLHELASVSSSSSSLVM
ncbi:unnamed protein product [Alopecurus aequalis]